MPELADVARAMVAPGRGILAADESTPTIKKRFDSVSAESTEDSRRAYREMLFTTEGAEQHISGVILFDETLRQSASDGTPFAKLLTARGMLPGIKVDKGAKDLPGAPGEKVTEGLDGLRERISEYVSLGAKFAKWRAVIDIADGIPSDYCIEANAHALARYAALCTEGGLVPIVEPEVMMDGAHDLARCHAVTERTLRAVFAQLYTQRVRLEEIVLKPNMVIPGKKCTARASVREVAEATLDCFRKTVPAQVPGIVFLSGGQSEEEATAHLNEMNKLGGSPWELSFSYGRALQASALKAWGGQASQLGAGQKAFLHRATCNGAARSGSYTPDQERAA
ncbi:MAG: fructose-bisphosphate aldolase class I [Deltaproteobacteria bacterium]|nr:fructose-bisphosphate aldolase class I [Deltaproteobacteria bacterium]MBW2359886.1 fructose-bisphosphate aldolase class I [Deltaproteobacteria bacterium]